VSPQVSSAHTHIIINRVIAPLNASQKATFGFSFDMEANKIELVGFRPGKKVKGRKFSATSTDNSPRPKKKKKNNAHKKTNLPELEVEETPEIVATPASRAKLIKDEVEEQRQSVSNMKMQRQALKEAIKTEKRHLRELHERERLAVEEEANQEMADMEVALGKLEEEIEKDRKSIETRLEQHKREIERAEGKVADKAEKLWAGREALEEKRVVQLERQANATKAAAIKPGAIESGAILESDTSQTSSARNVKSEIEVFDDYDHGNVYFPLYYMCSILSRQAPPLNKSGHEYYGEPDAHDLTAQSDLRFESAKEAAELVASEARNAKAFLANTATAKPYRTLPRNVSSYELMYSALGEVERLLQVAVFAYMNSAFTATAIREGWTHAKAIFISRLCLVLRNTNPNLQIGSQVVKGLQAYANLIDRIVHRDPIQIYEVLSFIRSCTAMANIVNSPTMAKEISQVRDEMETVIDADVEWFNSRMKMDQDNVRLMHEMSAKG
jgi:hypothetical protein